MLAVAPRTTATAKLSLSALIDPRPGATFPDPAVEGLRYRVRGSGHVYAELRWKGAGGWRSAPLGRVDIADILGDLLGDEDPEEPRRTATLDDALADIRADARELRRSLRAGKGPRGGITLSAALALHLQGKQRSPRTVRDYEDRVAQHFRDWLDKPLASITRAAVRERHLSLTDSIGPYGANGALRVLRAVWNRARRQHPELGESPTANVDWNPEHRADRAIPLAQLPTFWRDVHALVNTSRRDFYLLCLFTGLRRRSAAGIKVVEVDLQGRSLRIPKPKGGRPFNLPLSSFLYELLATRLVGLALSGHSQYLFPSPISASGHLEEPKVGPRWAGVSFTPHGLRNTYISAAVAASVHPYHIKLLVNHALPRSDVTAGYVGRDLDALREPQERVTQWLLERLTG